MPRCLQLLFIVSFLLLNWLLMMAVHEFGHVLGALGTGGKVTGVVLHPLSISRTDVAPNPAPAVVVWLGPVVGCLLPLVVATAIPGRLVVTGHMARFFAGFCLIANGAYISLGSFDRVGDCGEMLQTGSPVWVLWLFGAVTIPAGFAVWHRLGSVGPFFREPARIKPAWAVATFLTLAVLLALEFAFSPR